MDGSTGLLADDGPGLTAAVQRLVADDALRERMGEAARARAAGFTWERTARESADLLSETSARGARAPARGRGRSETLKAAGMAAATMANNALALVFTVLFARLLGATDYGSLAALVSTFVILSVPGSAVQVAVAREIALGRLGEGPRLAATLSTWRRRLVVIGVVLTACAVLLREPIADLISVPEEWAAAAVVPTGVLWLLLSVERGALQGAHLYKPVAWSIVLEAGGRLCFGLALVALGLGVTGAYLGTPLSLAAMAFGLWWISRARLGRARGRAPRRGGCAISSAAPGRRSLGLFLVALLQNVDVILVKRQIGGDAAGAYAAAAVAAKAVVWVAIGIGLYLLPEATRAARHGRDPRPVLARALAVVAAVAVPMLIVYGLFPSTVLRLAFGPETVVASDALFVLACAMTLLAVGYLGVQYMLALGRVAFLPALALVAVAELALLSAIGSKSLVVFAACVLALQAAAALSVLASASRPGRRAAAARGASDRGLADRGAGARGCVLPRRARGRTARSSRSAPSAASSTVVLARGRGRGDRDRSARGQRPRAAGDRGRGVARRCRPRGVPGQPGRGRRRRPRAPRAQVLVGRATAMWPVRCRCCTSTARTASTRRGRTSPTGAGGCARAGRCSSTTRSPRSA